MTFYVHNDPHNFLAITISESGWVWELWDNDHPIACSTRSYFTQRDCEDAIDSLKDAFQAQQIVARKPPH